MNKNVRSIILTAILLLTILQTSCTAGQTRKADQPQQHSYLCSDIGTKTMLIVSADGKVEWAYPVKLCTDAWVFKNSNVLFNFG